MPDKRIHRGPNPLDHALFCAERLPALRAATGDLSWLLSRGYAITSALKLVGDRHRLAQRQRIAVARAACSDDALARRRERQVPVERLAGRPLWIDGYNLLTTVEAALAGGVVLKARDGTFRDMASVHGTFRKVRETIPAIELVARILAQHRAASCVWYLDSPVSNSGRLKRTLLDAAAGANWPWTVELVPDPDALLSATDELVATADSAILDRCAGWVNLAAEITETFVARAWLVDFR
jgi:hypothetical protein